MRIDEPLVLLGGLSAASFMRRHWQRRPLLVRQAVPGLRPPLQRHELFALAARDDVESRLVVRRGRRWTLRAGPLPRRSLPPLHTAGWTLLVQGIDLHVPAARALLERFRFVPDARLDDLMLSYASNGGGVGPHVDSYDVFLLQAAGVRRWRIARRHDGALRDDVPLKMLASFAPEHEWRLEAGDMLYLPPGWAHDGEAIGGDCLTCSIGFRAPRRDELARELLLRLADSVPAGAALYADRSQAATATPARIPSALGAFAAAALKRALDEPRTIDAALGEWLSEPKPRTWFGPGAALAPAAGVRLDARTRMLYDAWRLYCNGETIVAAAADARLLRRLADRRVLSAAEMSRLGREVRAQLAAWAEAGWLHAGSEDDDSDDEERGSR